MKNKLLASMLLLAATTLTITADAETITVTASRLELPVTATLSDIIIIDEKEIEDTSAISLFELLQSKPGIDWVRKGGPGQEISMYVRGSSTNQLLVLLDGLEIGSATLGYKALADINLSQVARIEIVKGPRAAIWGSKAIGGVMQIFTREEPNTRLTFGFGSFNERRINIASGFENNALSASINVDRLRSDGIDARLDGDIDDDGIERDNVNLMTRFRPSSEQELTLRYSATEGLTEYDSAFGDDTLLIDNNALNLTYQVSQATSSSQITLGRQVDSSITQAAGVDLFNFETVSESFKYLFDTQQNEQWKLGTSLEYLNEDVGNSSTTYDAEQRDTVSGHVYSHYQTGSWVNEIALRYTDVENLASNTSMHAGVGFHITDQDLISINYGEGFKVPTFNDLYFPFGGNPDLKYELAENLELVYKQWFENGSLSISLYDNDISNLIQFTPDENGIFTANNVGSVNLRGADFDYQWQTASLHHQVTAQYVDAQDLVNRRDLQLRAKTHLSYLLSGEINSELGYQLSIRHTGKRPDFDYQTFTPIKLAAFNQFDLNFGYRLNNGWQLRLAIKDLLDEEGQYVSGYRAAGRTLRLSVYYNGQ